MKQLFDNYLKVNSKNEEKYCVLTKVEFETMKTLATNDEKHLRELTQRYQDLKQLFFELKDFINDTADEIKKRGI